jgi:biotin synthase
MEVFTEPQPTLHTWTLEEAKALYETPFTELVFQAQSVHRRFFSPDEVQWCTLLSVKTGGCPENCGYCPQSAHFDTGVAKETLDVASVHQAALAAKQAGSTRFCMGAAWREVREGAAFESVLEMVRAVSATGMEVCCTLGMLNASQAQRLAEAGLTAYNHNLDTGPGYYDRVVSTRTYQDRLNTLQAVRDAGISVCCGGIVGMGEHLEDRLELLVVLANQTPPPESVPINSLVRVDGTPLAHHTPVGAIEFVRMVAVARIMMPQSRIRLSAGRQEMHESTQALCFLAGANSIFTGEKLLTTPNPSQDTDHLLMQRLGMRIEPVAQPS